ncbi:MAG TPA: ester cyclase [Gemmatimonadales bacterium]|nr:ester cyclase [Gemmatimonadales bacterium]
MCLAFLGSLCRPVPVDQYRPPGPGGKHRCPLASCSNAPRRAILEGRIDLTCSAPCVSCRRQEIPPTGRKFDVEFCTVARREDGQIVEENLFYDLVTFMKQIGVGG